MLACCNIACCTVSTFAATCEVLRRLYNALYSVSLFDKDRNDLVILAFFFQSPKVGLLQKNWCVSFRLIFLVVLKPLKQLSNKKTFRNQDGFSQRDFQSPQKRIKFCHMFQIWMVDCFCFNGQYATLILISAEIQITSYFTDGNII